MAIILQFGPRWGNSTAPERCGPDRDIELLQHHYFELLCSLACFGRRVDGMLDLFKDVAGFLPDGGSCLSEIDKAKQCVAQLLLTLGAVEPADCVRTLSNGGNDPTKEA